MEDKFPTAIEEFEAQEGLTIWALGGPSVAIRTPQSLVYLDLFTGSAPGVALHKATDDIVDPEKIRRVDAVLCTHHDPDHCHEDSLAPIHANTEALFIGPRSCTKLFREWGFSSSRQVELSAWQAFQLKDLRIWALPCNDYFDPDAVSYVLQSGGVTAFEGGDTLYYSGYIKVGRQFEIDVALLNFARNPAGEIYYMNHAHVARTAEELGARMVIPKHYDLWEEFLDDPKLLAPLLEPKDIKLQILNQGEHIALSSAQD